MFYLKSKSVSLSCLVLQQANVYGYQVEKTYNENDMIISNEIDANKKLRSNMSRRAISIIFNFQTILLFIK